MAEIPIIEGLFEFEEEKKIEPEKKELPIIEGLFEGIKPLEIEPISFSWENMWKNLNDKAINFSKTIGSSENIIIQGINEFGHSFREASQIYGLLEKLRDIAPYPLFGEESPEYKYEGILEETEIAPETGINVVDTAVKFLGSAGGMVFDFASLGPIISPVAGLAPKVIQPGLKFAGTRMARTGIGELAGEDMELEDYAKAGIGGFLGGEAAHGLGVAMEHLPPRLLSDVIYPWTQRAIMGSGAGLGFTAADYLFDPEDTTLADFGINMLSMAFMYAAPMIFKSQREEVNQIRKDLIHTKALDENTRRDVYQKLGLSKDATEQDIKNKWREISQKLTKGNLKDLTEKEKLQILADTKRAREEALKVINNMSLSTKLKNIITQKLNQITTGIARKFTGTTTGALVPIEQQVTGIPVTPVEDFIGDIQARGIQAEDVIGKITTEEIVGLLIEPSKDIQAIELPGEIIPEAPMPMPGEVAKEIEGGKITEVETNATKPIKLENMNKRARIFAEKYGFFDNSLYMHWITRNANKFREERNLPEAANLPDEEFDNYLQGQPAEDEIFNRIDEIKRLKEERLKGLETGQIPEQIEPMGETMPAPLKPQIEAPVTPQIEIKPGSVEIKPGGVEPGREIPRIRPVAVGGKARVITSLDTEVEVQYDVVDISQLITSHDESLKANPAFPEEAQPRDRSKMATEEQVHNIYVGLDPERLGENRLAAHGAPIIGPDGVVEVGNARTIALKRLYRDNHKNAEKYKSWLIANAERFGLDPEKIGRTGMPVLVKERLTGINRQQFAQEANVEETARMSAVEQGAIDAQRLSRELLSKFIAHEEGTIQHAGNKEFITNFLEEVIGPSQKGQYVDSSGLLNQAGIRRIESAVFMRAYNDAEIAEELLESTDSSIKSITGAMMDVAPKTVDIKTKIEKGLIPNLDISRELTDAVRLYKKAKAVTGDIEGFLQAQSLFEETGLYTIGGEVEVALARIFNTNKRSRKRIRDTIQNYQYGIEALDIRSDMSSMFEDFQKNPPTKMELLEAAYRKMARGYKNVDADAIFGIEAGPEPTLFGKERPPISEGGTAYPPDEFTGTKGETAKINIDDKGHYYKNIEINNKETKMYIDAPYTLKDILDDKISLELPEIVEIAREINEGKYPRIVKKFREGGTLGRVLIKDDKGRIELRADIFIGPLIEQRVVNLDEEKVSEVINELKGKYPDVPPEKEFIMQTDFIDGETVVLVYEKNPGYAATILAHEIGHLVDWLPEKTMKRGNILGRLASLKGYLTHTLDDTEIGVLERDQIMNELKNLVREWDPFDPSANIKYTKYRYSSVELYADALSVLINSPDMMQVIAPTYYKAFMRFLDRKPEFKAVYEDVLARMRVRKAINESRAVKIYTGYERGLDKRIELTREKLREPESGMAFLARGLGDKYYDFLKIIAPHYREGGVNEEIAKHARNMLQEIAYIASEVEDYYHSQMGLIEEASKSGIEIKDLGLYAQEKRIITERELIANPEGHTPEVAKEQHEYLREKLGNEKYIKLLDLLRQFYNNRHERVVDRIISARMFNPAIEKKLMDNRYYVTFNPIAYPEIDPWIVEQYGTLLEIENPIISTMLKDAALLYSANMKEAKEAMIVALSTFTPENVSEAITEYDKNSGKMKPVPPKDKDKGMITYLSGGDIAAYYVPKIIADTFKHEPYVANTITNIFQSIMQKIKELWVSHNPGWMIANLPRDFNNTIMNNPEIKIRDIPGLIWSYKESLKEAWKEVRYGERSEDISYGRKYRMLPVGRLYESKDITVQDETLSLVESLLNRIDPKQIEQSKEASNALKKGWDFLNDIGQTTEVSGKLTGLKFLRDNIGLATEEIGNRVRNRVGTPNFKRRGSWHRATNSFFVFSTIRKEGWRSAFEAYSDNPAAYLWKLLVITVLPKLIQLGLQHAREVFPDSETAQEISETYDSVSNYRKENYLVVSLFNKDGKGHVLTLPQDFTGQLISSLLYDISEGDWGQAVFTIQEQLPYNLSNINPLTKLGIDAFSYLSGNNVYDFWRGRHVISEESMATGGLPKLQEFAAYEAGQLGSKMFVDISGLKYADTTGEVLLNIFPLNALRRFYHISDAGYMEDVNLIFRRRNEERAKGNYRSKYESAAAAISGRWNYIDAIRNNKVLSAEEKAARIKQAEKDLINHARIILGKEVLSEE